MFGITTWKVLLVVRAGDWCLSTGRSLSHTHTPHPPKMASGLTSGLPHLSAMWSCLASSASLLKVFHIASVSGVISRVSKKAVALKREGRKATVQAQQGAEEYWRWAGVAGPVVWPIPAPPASEPASPTTSRGCQPSPSPGVVAVINGRSKLDQALIQHVGNSRHTFGHHHLGLPTAPLQTYHITL